MPLLTDRINAGMLEGLEGPSPFLTQFPRTRQASGGPLTASEILEARRLGILPPANVGQVSGPQGPNPRVGSGPTPNIPRRVVSGGPDVIPSVSLTPAPAPSPLSQTLDARRAELNRQLEATTQQPDYSGLAQQMQQRSAAGMDDMYAAALAGIGPEAVQGFQPALLKQSLAARQPMKVEGGMIDESGRVMIDPGYQQAKKADQLRQRLAQLDVLETRMASDADKAALVHERNLILLMLGQMKADSAGGGYKDFATTYGYNPQTGNRVIEDRQGNQIEIMPDGSRVPFRGTAIPKAAFEKQTGQATELKARASRAAALLAEIDSNPDAFSFGAAATSMLPNIIQSRVMPHVLTPAQMEIRNRVLRQAAIEIHEIYGAALTMGEGQRATQWALTKEDSPETVLEKLRAAHDWAAYASEALGAQAARSANVRLPNQTPPPPRPAGAPTTPAAPRGGIAPGWSVREK